MPRKPSGAALPPLVHGPRLPLSSTTSASIFGPLAVVHGARGLERGRGGSRLASAPPLRALLKPQAILAGSVASFVAFLHCRLVPVVLLRLALRLA